MTKLVIEEPAEHFERVDEGLLVGMSDLSDHVPVAPAGRHVGERRPRGHPEKLAIGIELVKHGVEVALVDGSPVEKDERALGLAGRLADQMSHLHDLARPIAGGLLRRRHADW